MLKTPHLLLAGNPRKVRANLTHILSDAALTAIDSEINKNIRGLVLLGVGHQTFANGLDRAHWRQIVSRTYYAAYTFSRAVRLCHDGHYVADVTDHKMLGLLPDGFHNKNRYANKLPLLRDDRNLCDYDHSATEADLVIPVNEAEVLVSEFLFDVNLYLGERGVAQ